ncbi:protein of unknown function [Candidatus Nitrosocosmicus franklandus]|uniref:Uncharacterized protein n=1 Tax=Candidatus Nitrosocosmicus franklandianus TaxID=1798806 RepID=A0A484ICR4_9ARCH|nr:protein of unknown function [Candidatus Nitrosocosmicus franklandus]
MSNIYPVNYIVCSSHKDGVEVKKAKFIKPPSETRSINYTLMQ